MRDRQVVPVGDRPPQLHRTMGVQSSHGSRRRRRSPSIVRSLSKVQSAPVYRVRFAVGSAEESVNGSKPRRSPASPARARPDARRMTDILLAAGALSASGPVMLAAALAIKLEDGGPVLYRQERIGKEQRRFTVLKLRTMAPQASSEAHVRYITHLATQSPASAQDGDLFKLTNDARVTKVGRWLRRLSLDEVPQFVNVLAGDMSVVGPRPAIPYETAFYAPHHFERFRVSPGLTGLWQVAGRNRLNFRQMLDLDVTYVRRQSALRDLVILLLTPTALVGVNA